MEVRLPTNKYILGHSGRWGRARFTGNDVWIAIGMGMAGKSQKWIADYFGVTQSYVSMKIGAELNSPFFEQKTPARIIRPTEFQKEKERKQWMFSRRYLNRAKKLLRNLNRSRLQTEESKQDQTSPT
jgi:hypothetical protein